MTFVASLYNEIGKIMPKRRNMAHVRANDWSVDSKIAYTAVGANVDPLDYDDDEWDKVKQTLMP